MKNIKTILACLAALSLMGAMVSCDDYDYPDRYEVASGSPTVYSVRYTDRDINITQASMNESICLLGKNLRSITELWFNDQKAVLNTSYITDNTLIVTVPKTFPTVKTDKMYLINRDKDTTTFDFKVLSPLPVVNSMSNEYAAIGSEATIYGDYFVNSPVFKIAFTGADVDNSTIKFNGTKSVTFRVPQGAVEGYVKVTTESGTSQSKFCYLDSRGMLFDFDNPNPVTGVVLGNHGWHNMVIETDETALSGNFLRLGDVGTTLPANGAWDDGHFSFEYWAGDWDGGFSGDGVKLNDLADFSDFNNMALKFEMYIPSSNPWMSGPMQCIFAGPDKVTISTANNTFFHLDDGWPRTFYMPWKETGSYDTGDQWVTVTFPIGGSSSAFNKYWDGTPASASFSSPDDFASLTIFVVNGGGDAFNGTDCQPIIKIDNIRAVPNK